jgi:hypothetical protein
MLSLDLYSRKGRGSHAGPHRRNGTVLRARTRSSSSRSFFFFFFKSNISLMNNCEAVAVDAVRVDRSVGESMWPGPI